MIPRVMLTEVQRIIKIIVRTTALAGGPKDQLNIIEFVSRFLIGKTHPLTQVVLTRGMIDLVGSD